MVNGKLDFSFRLTVCRHCDEPPCVEVCPAQAIAYDTAKGIARKCNLCHHRVDKGLLPACADNVCPGHCIRFGDLHEIKQQPLGSRL